MPAERLDRALGLALEVAARAPGEASVGLAQQHRAALGVERAQRQLEHRLEQRFGIMLRIERADHRVERTQASRIRVRSR